MSETQTTKQPQANSPFDQLHNQETRQIVQQSGVYVIGAVEPWKVGNDSGEAGFIQLLVPQREDSRALKLIRIKAPESKFGLIDILNKQKSLQMVTLQIEISEKYGTGKMQMTLTEDQPHLKGR